MKKNTRYTHREDEIIKSLTSQGYTDAEIAERIGRSTQSVSGRKSILRNAGVEFEGIHCKKTSTKKAKEDSRQDEQITMKQDPTVLYQSFKDEWDAINRECEQADQRIKEAQNDRIAAAAKKDRFLKQYVELAELFGVAFGPDRRKTGEV